MRTAQRRKLTPSETRRALAKLFARNGYVRRQNSRRKRKEGYSVYKKGDEVRLVAGSVLERQRIMTLIRRAGFRPGKPFQKGKQYRIPIYGRAAVAAFLTYIGHDDA